MVCVCGGGQGDLQGFQIQLSFFSVSVLNEADRDDDFGDAHLGGRLALEPTAGHSVRPRQDHHELPLRHGVHRDQDVPVAHVRRRASAHVLSPGHG